MRLKTVLVIMVVAIGMLGLLVALKTIPSDRGTGPGKAATLDATNASSEAATVANPAAGIPMTVTNQNPVSVSPAASTEVATANLQPRPPVTNVVATTPEQDRQATVERELDRIKEALVDGGSDPKLVEGVRERLLHPEAEVRKAAVETLVHLNDRDSLPKLKEALAKVENPREKVAIMDAIEYLEIPENNPQMTTDTPLSGQLPSVQTQQANPRQPARQPQAKKN